MCDYDSLCETCGHHVCVRMDRTHTVMACAFDHDTDGDCDASSIDEPVTECDNYVDADETYRVGCDQCRGTLGAASISDGYHTMAELYHHRAVLFSVIVRDHSEVAWKSMRHHDGSMYDGMFIVGVETPEGQATYHYHVDHYWDMFDCDALDYAPAWDHHSPDEAIARLASLGRAGCHYEYVPSMHIGNLSLDCSGIRCDSCGREQMGLEPPKYCPGCGRRILR